MWTLLPMTETETDDNDIDPEQTYLWANRITDVATRRDTRNGDDHLVVENVTIGKPMRLSGGYIPEAVWRNTETEWNGVPLPIGHPTDPSGAYISANDPSIEDSAVVGRFYNASFNRGTGDLSGELWINLDRIDSVSHTNAADVVEQLENGDGLEISTGYRGIPGEPGVYDGAYRTDVLVDVRPDHVALLPNDLGPGRCSLEDGCGVPEGVAANGVPDVEPESVPAVHVNTFTGDDAAEREYTDVDVELDATEAMSLIERLRAYFAVDGNGTGHGRDHTNDHAHGNGDGDCCGDDATDPCDECADADADAMTPNADADGAEAVDSGESSNDRSGISNEGTDSAIQSASSTPSSSTDPTSPQPTDSDTETDPTVDADSNADPNSSMTDDTPEYDVDDLAESTPFSADVLSDMTDDELAHIAANVEDDDPEEPDESEAEGEQTPEEPAEPESEMETDPTDETETETDADADTDGEQPVTVDQLEAVVKSVIESEFGDTEAVAEVAANKAELESVLANQREREQSERDEYVSTILANADTFEEDHLREKETGDLRDLATAVSGAAPEPDVSGTDFSVVSQPPADGGLGANEEDDDIGPATGGTMAEFMANQEEDK